jgi:hypothetical protein
MRFSEGNRNVCSRKEEFVMDSSQEGGSGSNDYAYGSESNNTLTSQQNNLHVKRSRLLRHLNTRRMMSLGCARNIIWKVG